MPRNIIDDLDTVQYAQIRTRLHDQLEYETVELNEQDFLIVTHILEQPGLSHDVTINALASIREYTFGLEADNKTFFENTQWESRIEKGENITFPNGNDYVVMRAALGDVPSDESLAYTASDGQTRTIDAQKLRNFVGAYEATRTMVLSSISDHNRLYGQIREIRNENLRNTLVANRIEAIVQDLDAAAAQGSIKEPGIEDFKWLNQSLPEMLELVSESTNSQMHTPPFMRENTQ